MTVSDGGKLGDLISKYASLYAYARILQNTSTPLIPKTMHRLLKTKIFPHISIKTYNSEKCDTMFDWINGNIKFKAWVTAEQGNTSFINNNESTRYVVDCCNQGFRS